MRRILGACAFVVALGILLALLRPSPTLSDSDLTSLVNAAYPARVQDAALHDIAHQRAVEISTDFSHDGRREGTAEVLAWNSGSADPVSHVLGQWQGSPDHDAILRDPTYTRIGCGSHIVGGVYYAACLLAAAPATVGPAPGGDAKPTPAGATPTPQPVLLPNTATGP